MIILNKPFIPGLTFFNVYCRYHVFQNSAIMFSNISSYILVTLRENNMPKRERGIENYLTQKKKLSVNNTTSAKYPL